MTNSVACLTFIISSGVDNTNNCKKLNLKIFKYLTCINVFLFKKLQSKGIILRSTKEGYDIKNKLRLTIGSTEENLKFISTIKNIFNK